MDDHVLDPRKSMTTVTGRPRQVANAWVALRPCASRTPESLTRGGMGPVSTGSFGSTRARGFGVGVTVGLGVGFGVGFAVAVGLAVTVGVAVAAVVGVAVVVPETAGDAAVALAVAPVPVGTASPGLAGSVAAVTAAQAAAADAAPRACNPRDRCVRGSRFARARTRAPPSLHA
jgi:hypothetical protein